MEKADQIISMLEKVLIKQDEHSKILDEHSEVLNRHSEMHKKHEQQFENQSAQLKEHSQLLHALIAGQESLKAELDGFKVETRTNFREVKSELNTLTVNQKLVREDNWGARVDIERPKVEAPV